ATLDPSRTAALIGKMYHNADGFEKNDVEAARLFRLGAEHGDPSGQYWYGMALINGWGVEVQLKEGLAWIEKSAAQHHLKSLNEMGTRKRDGKDMERDHDAAFRLFTEAANRDDPDGLRNLADLYAKGLGVAKDTAKADE